MTAECGRHESERILFIYIPLIVIYDSVFATYDLVY